MAISGYTGVKIFSGTMQRDRDQMDARINDWIKSTGGEIEIVDTTCTQSSDAAFHCTTWTIYYRSIAGKK